MLLNSTSGHSSILLTFWVLNNINFLACFFSYLGQGIESRYDDSRVGTSKVELTCDFEKIYCKMNEMSLQLDKKSQVK